MRVAGFDWDEGNRSECQKHGVSTAAIESLFHRPIAVLPDPLHSKSEERFKAIGKTDRGRGYFRRVHPADAARQNTHSADQRPVHAQ